MSERAAIKYVELKIGGDRGPAWIARVKVSKSGRTVYFGGKALKRCLGVSGNHEDMVTGEEYWISSVKKDGTDRHWAGGGIVFIEEGVVEEYLSIIGSKSLNLRRLQVVPNLPQTDIEQFVVLENTKLDRERLGDEEF